MHSRLVLPLAIAVSLPAAPALALEVTPTGHLFSDYTVDLKETLTPGGSFAQTFGISRARIGVKAKEGPVSGMLQTDVTSAAGLLSVHLRHGFAELDTGMGRFRGGQFSTGWAIPVEQDLYPFRIQGVDFSTREDLFPTEDRGLSWTGSMGMASLNLGVFNGDGYKAEETKAKANFPKAYESTLRVKPMDGVEIDAHARFQDAVGGAQTQGTALAGFSADLGMFAIGGEGGLNMKQGGAATPSTGIGGSAFCYGRNLLPVPLFETPLVRVDYAGQDFSGAAGNPNAHYRVLAGLAHTWAPGAETMVSYEIENDLVTGAQTAQTVGWRGALKF